ncbi:RNA methyltransferase [Propioniferax innocua]
MVHAVFVDPESPEAFDIIDMAQRRGAPVQATTGRALAEMCDTVTPQGVLAVCGHLDVEPDDIPADAKLILVCARVRDPGNAGAIIRCADAFGADAVVISADSVDVYNPKVVRASVGSMFHLPLVLGVQLDMIIGDLQDRGFQVFAAEGSGEPVSQLASDGTLARPTAWVMGNEAWGLTPEDSVLCDRSVAVPIHGRAESLNLATAAAVLMYATATAQY